MAIEQVLYSQVVILCRKYLKITESNKNKMQLNSSSTVSLQDHSVCFILIFITLKKSLSHVNLTSEGKYFRGMTIHKIQIHLKYLRFQSKIQNVWRIKFSSNALMLKYCQKLLNSCCLSILESDFVSIIETKAAIATVLSI